MCRAAILLRVLSSVRFHVNREERGLQVSSAPLPFLLLFSEVWGDRREIGEKEHARGGEGVGGGTESRKCFIKADLLLFENTTLFPR